MSHNSSFDGIFFLYFIILSHSGTVHLRDIAEKAPIIKLAYDELDKFRWNEKDLIAYEERLIDLRKEEGILTQKLDDVREKGREEGKIEVAKAMLADNVDVNTIVKFTGLSISEIEKIARLKDTQLNAT